MRSVLFLSALISIALTGAQPAAAQTSNIGRIIFSDREPVKGQQGEPGQPDPKDPKGQQGAHGEYTLTNISNLFITAFLTHPLRQDLHQLAPALDLDSLTKGDYSKDAGYQFALYVDHRLIYKSNIWTGTREIQNPAKTLTLPLLDNSNMDMKWSQWYWLRFTHNGGDSALTEGPHLLRLEIRPYIRVGTDTLQGAVMAAGDLKMRVRHNVTVDVSKVLLTRPEPYEGFGLSNTGYDSNKIKQLKGLIDSGVFKRISSVVVIKNGNILIEEYFNGETRDTQHNPRSVGKSFASTMTGIAIRDGYLKSVDQTLGELYNVKSYANYAPEKEKVAIKDLLSMCSAFDGDDDDDNSPGNEENMYDKDNWVKWTLDLPVSTTRPRDRWHYFTAGAMLTGDILNKSVQGGLDAYADLKLFSPLGIRDYQWQYTPQHVANTAGGIQLKALDFAKYGQLYKNGGQWNGQQVLPADWVKTTFTKYHPIPGRTDEWYGYFFWNKKYRIGGQSYETWYCSGNGGNKIFVFTDQPLVIVVTATAYGMPFAHPQVDKMMTDYILPAVLGK